MVLVQIVLANAHWDTQETIARQFLSVLLGKMANYAKMEVLQLDNLVDVIVYVLEALLEIIANNLYHVMLE